VEYSSHEVSIRVPGRTLSVCLALAIAKADRSHEYAQECLSAILGAICKGVLQVVTTGTEELRRKPHDFPWEMLKCATIAGIFFHSVALWKSFQLVRSQLYMRRFKKWL
jgi:hypothetical protein